MSCKSLQHLPHEISLRMFDTLDSKITSACLGITCRAFYNMHVHLHGFVGLLSYTSESVPNPSLKKWKGPGRAEEYGAKWLSKREQKKADRMRALPEFINQKTYLHELLKSWIQAGRATELVFYKRGVPKFITEERREALEKECVEKRHARLQAKYGG
ncbi:hypothetical protein B0J14DRAFT_605097 [Halenospora varia]|nr:hypothetical protein B0J14DRAFT_605097 [Halenospora varia]